MPHGGAGGFSGWRPLFGGPLKTIDRLALGAVALVPAALWLLCWPFAEVGVNDDFGYAFIVERLLATGRFVYNGWSSPILGLQAIWGAAFAGALGFSHNALRISTLPLAMTCAALTFLLNRRLGVPTRWAIFATLALVGSPLFTPLATSFMTDVPGLTLTLTLFHLIVSLMRTPSARHAAIFAALIVVVGTLGGTVRQTNFVMAAAALVIAIWHRRRERPIAIVLALVAHAAITLAFLHWYARQPYSTLDPVPHIGQGPRAVRSMGFFALSFFLFTIPMTLACLRLLSIRAATKWGIAAACAAACVLLVLLVPPKAEPHLGLVPWSLNTITPTGLLPDGVDAPGQRAVIFGLPVRVALAAGIYWAIALTAIAAYRRRAAFVDAFHQARRGELDVDATAVAALLAIGVVYVGLLLPRAASGLTFDRYLLVPIPIASTVVLFAARRRLADASPGPWAYAALVVYAFVGVALTRDHFVELRTRDRIAADLAAAGIPRERITNGLTFDAWTQLVDMKYVNDSRIIKPAGAYVRDPQQKAREAIFWFLPLTPVIRPEWIVLNVPARPERTETTERLYSFRTVLPPRTSWILVRPLPPLAPPAPVTTTPADGR